MGEADILLIRRADGLLSVTGMGLTRELTIAVARRAVAAPTPALGAHVPFPAPAPVIAAAPLSIPQAQRNLPCVRAVTADDVQSLGRKEVLVEIQNPRSGYSACEWRSSTADNSGFKVTVITSEEFADARAANAAAYLAAERKSALAAPKPQTLTGVGDEAFWFPGPAPMLMARKAEGPSLRRRLTGAGGQEHAGRIRRNRAPDRSGPRTTGACLAASLTMC